MSAKSERAFGKIPVGFQAVAAVEVYLTERRKVTYVPGRMLNDNLYNKYIIEM